jgi:hypothetical protein
MSDSSWTQTIADLKKELALMESGSRNIGRRSESMQRETEYLKIEFLKYSLEKQGKALARQRGMGLLIRDKKKIGTGLAVAVGGLIFGGLISKDKYTALNAGMAGFNGVLQGFGKTAWVVSVEKELIVASYDAMSPRKTWVTLESLTAAIDDLKAEVLQAKKLGTLDNIIQRLQQSTKLIYVSLPT